MHSGEPSDLALLQRRTKMHLSVHAGTIQLMLAVDARIDRHAECRNVNRSRRDLKRKRSRSSEKTVFCPERGERAKVEAISDASGYIMVNLA